MVVFLVGPTGIGKTEVSVKLAKKIGGEIISCDSIDIQGYEYNYLSPAQGFVEIG
jgi:tRNA dimethylallyltransferase